MKPAKKAAQRAKPSSQNSCKKVNKKNEVSTKAEEPALRNKMKPAKKAAQKAKPSSQNSCKKVNKKNEVSTKAEEPALRKRKAKNSDPTTLSNIDEVKTIVPVDAECYAKLGKAHVYSENKDVYNAMLNQTNLQFNNNKYYLLQLLKDNGDNMYSVWFRWGRVGKKGQTSFQDFGSNLQLAKNCFEGKFQEKTKNKWEERNKFKKVEGKYDLVSIEYDTNKASATAEKSSSKPAKKLKISESKLKKQVQDLIKLIFDMKVMEETATEMNYDAKKVPLGNLTTEQIKAGYLALKKIEEFIRVDKTTGNEFVKACNEFYTRIPHDFGMKRPPLITTTLEVKQKAELLEVLGGIEIAMQIMTMDSADVHPVDHQYEKLSCELKPLEESHPDYKIITTYLEHTHGATHRHYALRLINAFTCHKATEEENFCDYGNKMLLWHGSRLSNWAGILKTGLRIAPPEAPVTGYMFGKGIYFADMVSKSANYCYATDEGLLLLCEVSLGNQNVMRNANFKASELPKGYHSVFAEGRTHSNPEEAVLLSDNVKVPVGKPVTKLDVYPLQYNEYIVYNRNQVKMRYILRVKFDYKATLV